MKPDLGDLNAFVAVARAKGFRDGARVTGTSVSGLSEAVRRLEEQLGVRLLNRTTRHVEATSEGALYYQRCRAILADIDEVELAVSETRATPRGCLRVAVPEFRHHGARPPARIGELVLGCIDRDGGRGHTALDQKLGECAVAAADVEPPRAFRQIEPIQENVAGQPAPPAHQPLVGLAISAKRRRFAHDTSSLKAR